MVDSTALPINQQIDEKNNALFVYDLVATNSVISQGNLVVDGNATITGTLNSSGNVVASGGATVQLTAAQSGSIMLFDSAAGVVYTLPTAAAGLEFEFVVTTSCTSNSHKVITKNATELLFGTLSGVNTASSDAMLSFTGNGSTHIAVTQAAASTNSTGGLVGSRLKLTCISATRWLAEGVLNAGTTFATPFATS